MHGVAITLSNSREVDGVKTKKGRQKPNKLPLFSKEVSLGKLESRERQKEDVFPSQIHVHTMQSSRTAIQNL